MSDKSENSVSTQVSFLKSVSLTKVAGSLIVLGLATSAGVYLYNNYYKNTDNDSSIESKEV